MAREGDALLLAARQALRQAVLVLRDLHDIEDLVYLLLHLGLRRLAELESVLDILAHRHVREDRIALEDHADIALVRRDIVDDLVIEADLAAFNGVEARDHAQKRRLSASRRAEQGKEFSILDVLRQSRDDGQLAVALDDLVDVDCHTHRITFLPPQDSTILRFTMRSKIPIYLIYLHCKKNSRMEQSQILQYYPQN